MTLNPYLVPGNNWGKCSNGTEAVGCGPQEEFRACADIQISDGKGEADDTPYPTRRPTTSTPVSQSTTPTSTPDDADNEIPDDDDISKEYFAVDYAMVAMVTILLAFSIAVLIFLSIYVYYYHIDRTLGKSKGGVCVSLKAVWDKTKRVIVKGELSKGVSEPPVSEAPVPPPRVKKNTTIGFKGVPDNLI